MSYLDVRVAASAQDDVDRIHDAERRRLGYLPNYVEVFGLRPAVYDAWAQLNITVKAGMDLRHYELATLAAARRLRSSYCSLAHGALLCKFYAPATVARIAADHHDAGLDDAEVALMDFAEKVADSAFSVTRADIQTLRQHGFAEADVFQIVLAVAARCFFSTVVDAVGAEPDSQYRSSLDPQLLRVLTVGRPVAA